MVPREHHSNAHLSKEDVLHIYHYIESMESGRDTEEFDICQRHREAQVLLLGGALMTIPFSFWFRMRM